MFISNYGKVLLMRFLVKKSDMHQNYLKKNIQSQ